MANAVSVYKNAEDTRPEGTNQMPHQDRGDEDIPCSISNKPWDANHFNFQEVGEVTNISHTHCCT
jgi:hypothetical protein